MNAADATAGFESVSAFSSAAPEHEQAAESARARVQKLPRRTTVSLIKAHLAGWRDWEMNPVLLKELRQAVRSQILITMLLILLTVLFVISLGFLVRQDVFSEKNPALGQPLFSVLLMLLTAISMLFVPLYVGIRLAYERRKHNVDLMFFTAIPAGTMARGKFLCGAYLIAMFFSVCSPFMVFTNLLRGVDLLTIIFILVCLYFVACLAVQSAIFVACLPLHTAFECLSGILYVAVLVGATFGVMMVFSGLIRSGVGTGLTFWFGSFMTLVLILCGTGLLQVMSVSLIATDRRPRGYYNEIIQKEQVP